MAETIKKIAKSNLIFLVGILLLTYKALFLNCVLDLSFTYKTVLYIILAAFLIMCPTINNRKKFSYIYLNIVYMIITIVIYANFLYYSYSTNFLSFYQIGNTRYASEIGTGLSGIVNFQNVLMFWMDNIIILILSVTSYKKLEKVKYENKISKIIAICAIILTNIIVVKTDIHNTYQTKIYNKSNIVEDISIYYYQYEDAKDYFLSGFTKQEIDEEQLKAIYEENKAEKSSKTDYTGIAKNSNVIILQLESLNEYIIGKKVNGKEITPNLNKFFKENIYCSNMYNQGLGTTADSEFEMENSMYPLENGYVFQKYYGNKWLDIYTNLREKGYYTSFMHPNVSTFWNRDAVYHTGYNIDEYNDIDSFPDIEKAGSFYSDEGFFKKAVEIMNSYEGRFCTTLVSVTTHTAFGLEGVSNLEEKTTITNEDVEEYDDWIMRNYIISCNFVDYAFGRFLEDLEATGLADNSILVVYGDHGAGLTCKEDIKKLYEENDTEYTDFEKRMIDVHVPFGIRVPNINESKKIEKAVSKIDIKPTIMDLLGVKDKFSLGDTIFSNKDYSCIKGLGFVTSKYYCINDKYYDRITFKQVENAKEIEDLEKLSQKLQNEMYLSDMIIKNNLLKTNQENQEEKEETTSASLIMVGDNLVHSSIYKEAYRNTNGKGYNFKPMIKYIKEKVKGYDIAYYNQETIIGGTEIGLSDYPCFNSPKETADAMLDAGFNLVSLASNHTMDRGETAILNSRKYWDKQEDVLAVGSYDSEEARNEVNIMEKNGITYTMLNYTYGTNGIPVPEGKEYLVNVWPTDLHINDPERDTKYQEYKEQVKEDIARVRDKVDVLIVAMHCGIEYMEDPSSYQKDEAKFLAEQGVDIVIGTHPHVLEPVEWIDDTIVFYSLGNFISAQYQDENYNKTVGLMSSLNITKTTKGNDTTISIDDIENELIYTYYNQNTWSNFKVIPFSNQEIANYLPGYKKVYERYKKIVQKYDKDMWVVPCYSK